MCGLYIYIYRSIMQYQIYIQVHVYTVCHCRLYIYFRTFTLLKTFPNVNVQILRQSDFRLHLLRPVCEGQKHRYKKSNQCISWCILYVVLSRALYMTTHPVHDFSPRRRQVAACLRGPPRSAGAPAAPSRRRCRSRRTCAAPCASEDPASRGYPGTAQRPG